MKYTLKPKTMTIKNKLILITIGLIYILGMSLIYMKQTVNTVEYEHHAMYFIWNADDEGLPAVGEDVTIESIDGDTIYLVPKEDYIPK